MSVPVDEQSVDLTFETKIKSGCGAERSERFAEFIAHRFYSEDDVRRPNLKCWR